MMQPQEFFVTGGKASSSVSELNAFDEALKVAGIAQCTLVSVSSILPKGCKERTRTRIPAGTLTFTVMAKMNGREGETIGAGVAWAWEQNGAYGLVAETYGYTDRQAMLEILEWKMLEMAKIREIEVGGIRYRTEVLQVPMDCYGCVLAALVYL